MQRGPRLRRLQHETSAMRNPPPSPGRYGSSSRLLFPPDVMSSRSSFTAFGCPTATSRNCWLSVGGGLMSPCTVGSAVPPLLSEAARPPARCRVRWFVEYLCEVSGSGLRLRAIVSSARSCVFVSRGDTVAAPRFSSGPRHNQGTPVESYRPARLSMCSMSCPSAWHRTER